MVLKAADGHPIVEDLFNEIWLPIIGYEGLYEISNFGRVKRIKGGTGTYIGRLNHQFLNEDGYFYVSLSKNTIANGRAKVHKLVALAFIPNINNKPTINHINGIKTDNRVENLEWATYSENVLHAFDNGLMPSGEKHHMTKLTRHQVIEIHDMGLSRWPKICELAIQYNAGASTIYAIQRERTWKYLWKELRNET